MGGAVIISQRTTPDHADGIAAAHWDTLRRSLRGDVFRFSDERYQSVQQTFHGQFDHIAPQAVVLCENPADVAACLAFCRDHDLPVAVRSGGHSLGGYSTGPGLVVNTSRLAQVRVNPPSRDGEVTVTLGAGTQQIDSLTALWPHGLTTPNGLCPTVCAGGFIAGGGFGWTTRRYGMACDHMVSAQIVLADGRVVRCSESEEPDLFWALRGGGGGNFGVVTEYELRPRRIARLITFALAWPWDAAAAVISAWQRWVINGPADLGSALAIPLSDGDAGSPTVIVSGGWLGDRDGLDGLITALIAEAGRPPTSRNVDERSYFDAMAVAYGGVDKSVEQRRWVGQDPQGTIPREHFLIDRNRMIEQEIPPSGIDELLTAFASDHGAGQHRFLSFFALGGAVNEVPREATAYVHRTTQFYLGYSVGLGSDVPGDDDTRAAEAWVDAGFAAADRYSAGESYQNFIDPRLEDWQRAYYAENYPRLAAVKRDYDPDGLFRFAQSIG